jgi:GT2 family glycosyltransferase
MRTLASFQGIHSGEKIVVCGCGVSLKDLERPERFITVGVNDVGRLFQPKYLLVVDPKERFKGDRFHYVETSQAEYLFTQLELGVSHPNVVNFRLGNKDGTDLSDPNVLHYSVITPYMALFLAAHMGANYIGLIGVDFTDHHFFGNTGPHAWTPHLADIDERFHRLGAALFTRGIKVFNLSRGSRLTAFPKMALETFSALPVATGKDSRQEPLRIVSYTTTPVAGVPAVLTRCINARTPHHSRCLWASGDYGNGVAYESDINWNQSPAAAVAELTAADVVVLHNGKIDPRHRHLVAGKCVLTMADDYMRNVDPGFVEQDFPGVVVGQYQATLPEFKEWPVVPNPIPLWEEAYQPGNKDPVVTICYTSSNKHQQPPHSDGHDTTVAILEKLNDEFPLHLEIVGDHQVSPADALAMKRRAHIVIDECVTGSYHRNSLEALATGCVVVNGVGLLPGVRDAICKCIGGDAPNPFVYATLETLEDVLRELIERGPEELAAKGASNRFWMERHWDFTSQWERSWRPAIEKGLHRSRQAAKAAQSERRTTMSSQSASRYVSVVVVTLNEGEYLRRTIDSLAATLPDNGEIIVVDDGSSDGSADFLKGGTDRVTLLRPAERLGSARARNFGAQHARGKVLTFCDAHVAVPADWAGPLVAVLNQPDVGAVMPAIRVMRYPDDYTSTSPSKEARGYGLRWRDASLSVDWLGCKQQEPYPVPLLGAAFLAIRRNLFAAIGGFDSGLAIWGSEDAELSLRLWTLGYECLVVPEVDVAHRFRNERPYRVEWEMVLYNKLRLATIHFGAERRQRVIERLKQNGGFSAAMTRLGSSDADARRSQLHSLRRFDDDWFFQKFRVELTSDLADVAEPGVNAPTQHS